MAMGGPECLFSLIERSESADNLDVGGCCSLNIFLEGCHLLLFKLSYMDVNLAVRI